MPTDRFAQVETVESGGVTYACVFDLVTWIRDMATDEAFTEEHREAFVYFANQLIRLVTK